MVGLGVARSGVSRHGLVWKLSKGTNMNTTKTTMRVPSPDIVQDIPSSVTVPAIVAQWPAPAVAPIVPVPQLPQTSVAKIAQSISAVMSEIGIIGKDGRNEFHRYDYAKMEDILQRLTPLMARHGLVVFQTEVDRTMFDEDRAVAVRYAFTIVHSSGEVWPEHPVQTGLSRCRDSKGGFDDKSFNKAHTAARKYFLLALFQIPTGDDDDADKGGNDGPQRVAPKSRVPSPPPPPTDWTPHAFKAGTTAEWSSLMLSFIAEAKTADEVAQWDEANRDNLQLLAKKDPARLKTVMKAMKARREELTPAEVVTADGEIVPADSIMPPPTKDPEAARKWVVGKLAGFKSLDSAQTFWDRLVAPRESDFFPPDWTDLIAAWDAAEKRLMAGDEG